MTLQENTSLTVKELATLCESSFEGHAEHVIDGCADLISASSTDAAFLGGARLGAPGNRYRSDFDASAAGAIFVHPDIPRLKGRNYLISTDPSLAFQRLLNHFAKRRAHKSGFTGIHPSAVIHESVSLGDNVSIGPNVCIDQGCSIGSGTHIYPCCSIGPGVQIGSDCVIHANVSVRESCVLGDRVILQSGAVIGACGFGYNTNAKGIHEKLPQVGAVILENDVEVGANTCIDRARFGATSIGQGTKIDDLVMIGHNCRIGPHNLIVAQTGVAGSSSTGSHVVLAAQVGVTGHIHIDDQAMIGARSGVSKSMASGQFQGNPAVPLKDFQRTTVNHRRMPKKVRALEEKVRLLEDNLGKCSS